MCQLPGCGDGFIQGQEECDDGNTVTETCAYGRPGCEVCRADCTIGVGDARYCGDGILDPEEAVTMVTQSQQMIVQTFADLPVWRRSRSKGIGA